jgi:hypothetical protein
LLDLEGLVVRFYAAAAGVRPGLQCPLCKRWKHLPSRRNLTVPQTVTGEGFRGVVGVQRTREQLMRRCRSGFIRKNAEGYGKDYRLMCLTVCT